MQSADSPSNSNRSEVATGKSGVRLTRFERVRLEVAYIRGMKDALQIAEETECVWPPSAIRDRITEIEHPELLHPADITITDRASYFDERVGAVAESALRSRVLLKDEAKGTKAYQESGLSEDMLRRGYKP